MILQTMTVKEIFYFFGLKCCFHGNHKVEIRLHKSKKAMIIFENLLKINEPISLFKTYMIQSPFNTHSFCKTLFYIFPLLAFYIIL